MDRHPGISEMNEESKDKALENYPIYIWKRRWYHHESEKEGIQGHVVYWKQIKKVSHRRKRLTPPNAADTFRKTKTNMTTGFGNIKVIGDLTREIQLSGLIRVD